eukprot:11123469-Karenia_brevis.AAC.1
MQAKLDLQGDGSLTITARECSELPLATTEPWCRTCGTVGGKTYKTGRGVCPLEPIPPRAKRQGLYTCMHIFFNFP